MKNIMNRHGARRIALLLVAALVTVLFPATAFAAQYEVYDLKVEIPLPIVGEDMPSSAEVWVYGGRSDYVTQMLLSWKTSDGWQVNGKAEAGKLYVPEVILAPRYPEEFFDNYEHYGNGSTGKATFRYGVGNYYSVPEIEWKNATYMTLKCQRTLAAMKADEIQIGVHANGNIAIDEVSCGGKAYTLTDGFCYVPYSAEDELRVTAHSTYSPNDIIMGADLTYYTAPEAYVYTEKTQHLDATDVDGSESNARYVSCTLPSGTRLAQFDLEYGQMPLKGQASMTLTDFGSSEDVPPENAVLNDMEITSGGHTLSQDGKFFTVQTGSEGEIVISGKNDRPYFALSGVSVTTEPPADVDANVETADNGQVSIRFTVPEDTVSVDVKPILEPQTGYAFVGIAPMPMVNGQTAALLANVYTGSPEDPQSAFKLAADKGYVTTADGTSVTTLEVCAPNWLRPQDLACTATSEKSGEDSIDLEVTASVPEDNASNLVRFSFVVPDDIRVVRAEVTCRAETVWPMLVPEGIDGLTIEGGEDVSVEGIPAQVLRGLTFDSETGHTPTVTAVLSALEVPSGYTMQVLSATEEILAEDAPVGTGCAIATSAEDGRIVSELIAIVRGDVTGSGKMDITQLVRMAAAIRGEDPLTGPFLAAGDLNGNGRIDIPDLVQEAALLIAH